MEASGNFSAASGQGRGPWLAFLARSPRYEGPRCYRRPGVLSVNPARRNASAIASPLTDPGNGSSPHASRSSKPGCGSRSLCDSKLQSGVKNAGPKNPGTGISNPFLSSGQSRELSVPLGPLHIDGIAPAAGGTGISNPVPSGGESANFRFLSRVRASEPTD